MAFIKANLTVVICAVVVLLALGICVWPTMGWDETQQKLMKDRIDEGKGADSLIMSNLEVVPGGLTLKGATVETNVIEAKKWALEKMKSQAEEVAKRAAAQNLINRIIVEKGSGTNPEREIPLLSNQRPEDNFLPAIVRPADPFTFKTDYERQFPAWVQKLGGGTPPTVMERDAAIAAADTERTRQAAQNGAIFRPAAGQPSQDQLSMKEKNQIAKALVYARASKILCYVDEGALQKRDWFGKSNPPNETQIFEAFVDSWFQQDVVNAIIALNNEVLPKDGVDRNVGRSAVKRLESIVVGNGAMGNGGAAGLFLASTTAGQAASANGLEMARSLTGHVGTAEYDVVPMKIVVDINPAYENQFIQALYRQNNGYTELNRSIRSVDPLEATSNGFLYGPTQVVRLELLVEGLLFHSWTGPLMPPDIRKGLSGSGTMMASPSGYGAPMGNPMGGPPPMGNSGGGGPSLESRRARMSH